MAWVERAACRGRTDLFFPPDGRRWDPGPAIKVCGECPVSWECLNEALAARERWGVWAGFDFEAERVEARRERQRQQARERAKTRREAAA